MRMRSRRFSWRRDSEVNRGAGARDLVDQKQQVAIELAQADLAEAEANVAKTVHGTSTEELRQGRAEAEVSEAHSDLAKREAERSAHLGSESAVSPADVERAETEAKAAAANARRSAARLAELERGVRIEDRSAVRERLTAARARLKMAKLNLERRRVVAPAASRCSSVDFMSASSLKSEARRSSSWETCPNFRSA